MNFLSLIGVEFQKIRRTKILWILFAATLLLWLPSILNSHLNFEMQAEGISPENNFFIQGFLGMAWFMLPAGMVVGTVLLTQVERRSRGLLKMLSLPVNIPALCFAKFIVLCALAAVQVLMITGVYYISAWIVTWKHTYLFLLSPVFVCKAAVCFYLSAIPMLAVFLMIAVCVKTPVFSIGICLASIVPAILMINTKLWFLYPICYPLYFITSEYGKLAANLSTESFRLFPLVPAAASITVICLLISCTLFGRAERK